MRYLTTILSCLTLAYGAMADVVSDLRPVINEAATQHGVDPVLVEAIIRHESANGTSTAARKKNNLAGIMGSRGQKRYESKEASVRDLARLLGEYKAKGRVNVSQIARAYCVATGTWTRQVNSNMAKIRNGEWGELEKAK